MDKKKTIISKIKLFFGIFWFTSSREHIHLYQDYIVMIPIHNSTCSQSPWSCLAQSNILSVGKDFTFFSSGWILNSRCRAEFFIQWHIYKRYKTLIEHSGPLWEACRMVSLQLSEFNLIPLSSAHAYLQLKFFWGIVSIESPESIELREWNITKLIVERCQGVLTEDEFRTDSQLRLKCFTLL